MLGAIAQGETRSRTASRGRPPPLPVVRSLGAEISELNTELCRLKVLDWAACKSADVLNAGNWHYFAADARTVSFHPGRLFVVTGDSSLRSRPMSRVVHPLQQMGAQIWDAKAAR